MRCINVGDGSSVYIVLNMITLHCSVVGKLRVWGGNASRVFNNEGCKGCYVTERVTVSQCGVLLIDCLID